MSAVRQRGTVLWQALCAAAIVLSAWGTPADARVGKDSPRISPSPEGLFARALGNGDIAYVATRTSIFWSESGQTRAFIARVYKDGPRVRYEYPARGNRMARVIIETVDTLYVINPDTRKVTRARRAYDPDVDGVRVKLALANYKWRFEPAPSKRYRVVAAFRAGAAQPSQKFWIALEPMIVVRSERYGAHGELVSSWALDNLHVVDRLPDSQFEPPHRADFEVKEAVLPLPEQVHLADVQARVGFEPLLLPKAQLPEGYKLVDIAIEQTSALSNAVRLVYSDGLDSISLLEAEAPHHKGQRITIKAAHARDVKILDTTAQVFTSAEANLVHWQGSQRLYTLIGSLPAHTLVEMSRALIMSSRQRPHAALQTAPPPAVAPAVPHHRSFAEILSRGWARLLRLIGLG